MRTRHAQSIAPASSGNPVDDEKLYSPEGDVDPNTVSMFVKPGVRVVGTCRKLSDGDWRAEALALGGFFDAVVAKRAGLPSAAAGFAWLETLGFVTEWAGRRRSKSRKPARAEQVSEGGTP